MEIVINIIGTLSNNGTHHILQRMVCPGVWTGSHTAPNCQACRSKRWRPRMSISTDPSSCRCCSVSLPPPLVRRRASTDPIWTVCDSMESYWVVLIGSKWWNQYNESIQDMYNDIRSFQLPMLLRTGSEEYPHSTQWRTFLRCPKNVFQR